MRLKILAAATIIAFFMGLFFLFAPTQTDVQVVSDIKGHKAAFKNKEFLLRKINELDYWKHAKVNRLRFVLSTTPQYVVMGFRGSKTDPKKPVAAIAYGVEVTGKTQSLILYVNPDMYPVSDKANLEQQYSQTALLALFRMAPWKTPKTPEGTKQFISDYRADMTNNKIFSIE